MIEINVLINNYIELAHIRTKPITTTGKCMCTPFISLPRFNFRHITSELETTKGGAVYIEER